MRILGLLLFIALIYVAYKSNQPSDSEILDIDLDRKDQPKSTHEYEIKD